MSRTHETSKVDAERSEPLSLSVRLDGREAWIAWSALRDLEHAYAIRPDYPTTLAQAEKDLMEKLKPVALQYLNEHVTVRRA